MRLFIGIDIGATWTRIALADASGSILKKVAFRTPRTGEEDAIPRAIIETIRSEFGQHLENVERIGVGSIGPLDLSKGAVTGAPNVPTRRFEIARPIMEELKKPVYVANDCVAAIWGERMFGAARDVENAVYITLSTGIGGGIILNGTLLLGKRGNGHEIGHIVVDSQRIMRCNCGGYGHWEAYCGGASIPRYAAYLLERMDISAEERERSRVYKAFTENALSTELIYSAAKEGDPIAIKIVSEINKFNIAGFESVVNIYDPEIIIVGGSIALNNPELVVEPIKSVIESGRGLLTDPPRILLTPLGGDACLLGAIAIAISPPNELVKLLKYLSSF